MGSDHDEVEHDGRQWFEFGVSVFDYFEIQGEDRHEAALDLEAKVDTGDLHNFAVNEGEVVSEGGDGEDPTFEFGCSTFGIFHTRAFDEAEIAEAQIPKVDDGDFTGTWLNYAKPLLEDDIDEEKFVPVVPVESPAEDSDEDTGELWGGDENDLERQLEEHYDIEGLWFQSDFYDGEEGETFQDVLLYFDGSEPHLIDSDLTMLGHSESGAVGVKTESLPSQEAVEEVAEGA